MQDIVYQFVCLLAFLMFRTALHTLTWLELPGNELRLWRSGTQWISDLSYSNASLNKLSCCTHTEIVKGETIKNDFFFLTLNHFTTVINIWILLHMPFIKNDTLFRHVEPPCCLWREVWEDPWKQLHLVYELTTYQFYFQACGPWEVLDFEVSRPPAPSQNCLPGNFASHSCRSQRCRKCRIHSHLYYPRSCLQNRSFVLVCNTCRSDIANSHVSRSLKGEEWGYPGESHCHAFQQGYWKVTSQRVWYLGGGGWSRAVLLKAFGSPEVPIHYQFISFVFCQEIA